MILRIHKVLGIGLAALVVMAGACSDAAGRSAATDDRPLVIATTSIWGDIVGRVVGDSATVEVLIPRGVDPHDFQASSRQAARLRDASLVVANGLGLEAGIAGVLDSAEADGVPVTYLGDFITPRLLTGSDRPDPHFWTDPRLVRESLAGLTSALSRNVDLPPATWTDAAGDLETDLGSLNATLLSLTSSVPSERRKLVTTHDSLGYFAAAYVIELVGVVVPGGSTLASPSSAGLSALVDAIGAGGVAAIFVDQGQFEGLAESIASETGVTVVPIVVASLGDPGSGSDDYFGMMLRLGEAIRDNLA